MVGRCLLGGWQVVGRWSVGGRQVVSRWSVGRWSVSGWQVVSQLMVGKWSQLPNLLLAVKDFFTYVYLYRHHGARASGDPSTTSPRFPGKRSLVQLCFVQHHGANVTCQFIYLQLNEAKHMINGFSNSQMRWYIARKCSHCKLMCEAQVVCIYLRVLGI